MNTILSGIAAAMSLVQRLGEIGKKLNNAEFTKLLTDLSFELSDAKMKLVAYMEEDVQLRAEIASLKGKQEQERPIITIENGVYYKSDGDGPFCTGCYDKEHRLIRLDKQKSPLSDFGTHYCPDCKKLYTP
jgi:hypothetical protein